MGGMEVGVELDGRSSPSVDCCQAASKGYFTGAINCAKKSNNK